jgi:S-formylglutathione hydrolase
LGAYRGTWAQYDACKLISTRQSRQELFVDQGEADNFKNEQLKPEQLQAVCAEVDHPLIYRSHAGYDHSYFFIATFIEDHLRYHAKHLFNRAE